MDIFTHSDICIKHTDLNTYELQYYYFILTTPLVKDGKKQNPFWKSVTLVCCYTARFPPAGLSVHKVG